MPRTMSEDDIIEVLETIIRESGNAQAKISAIRALREMGVETGRENDQFADLERFPGIRRKSAA